MPKFAASLVCALAVSACVNMYEEPDVPSASAVMEFTKASEEPDKNGFAGEYDMIYEAVAGDACEARARLAILNSTPDVQRRRMPAGKPVLLVATMPRAEFVRPGDSSTGFGADMQRSECRALIRFSPETGHTYVVGQVVHDYEMADCSAEVTDKDTSAPPPDLQIENNFRCPPK